VNDFPPEPTVGGDAAVTIDKALKRLREEPRERRWPNVRPRDAATLIIVDRSGKTPKVLMGRRHASHKFMPNKYVFPGGRVDPQDRRMAVAGILGAETEAKLLHRVQRPTNSRARALGLAAIRETFEETGLLIGTRDNGGAESAPLGPWTDFAGRGVMPSLEPLHFLARAITPPRRPKRFDARFFVVDHTAICDQVEGVVGPDSELIDLLWPTLAETEDMELPVITRIVLDELAEALGAGLSVRRPVPFYYERNNQFTRDFI
jgi:8-oxo-dGTP pyrophosphatase MutT (NUDIX family)